MSRFFFHIYDGRDTFDHEGAECDGIREVRLRMLDIATKAVLAADPQREVWSMEAMNRKGIVVGSMNFGLMSSTDYRN